MKQIPRNVSIMAMALVAVSLTGSFAVADEFKGGQIATQEAGMYGHITAKVLDETGNVKQYVQSDNKIVQNGVDMLVINTLVPSSAYTGGIDTALGDVQYMQIGTGSGAGTSADNTITTIGGCAPVTFTGTGAGASDSVGFATTSVTLSSTFSGASCAATVAEAGLFDGSTGSGTDDMFSRGIFGSSVVLGAADSLDVDWTFTFTDT